jgi:5-methylthioadenosine/S-adenosylhomocysteine deaminase
MTEAQTNAPIDVDLILKPSWLITVNENFDVLEDHSLVINNGIIIDIVSNLNAHKTYNATQRIELDGQALLPGFINTHNHAAMNLFRGYADDVALQSWLNDFIWPAEGKWISENFIRDGSLLACAEMIKSGTTCFNDMYYFPDIVGQIADNCHMRSNLSFPILEFPSIWAQNADEYINKGLELHDLYKNHALISTAFGPHAPYTIETETFTRVTTLAEEIDANIHMHLHENQQEVTDYKAQHKQSAIEHYAELGLLSPRLQAVHMTTLTSNEIDLIAKHKVNVVHCPESNMKLASGICPITELQKNDIHISLGTDGSASNNDLDMIGEMKSAALLAKVASGDATALNAQQTLCMATINGAKTLGLDKICGSLEIGKSADMISIDLSGIDTSPVYNPVSQIVYSANKSLVSNSWVAGKQLLKEGQLTLIDEKEVLKNTQNWKSKISS